MWSMWNAPSDRDYYDPYGRDEEGDEPEGCVHCGARWDQACEEWCTTNAPASEAASEDANSEPFGQTGTSTELITRCVFGVSVGSPV